jgi:hypothetical protein
MKIPIKKMCNNIINEHIDRMHILCEQGRSKDAEFVYNEIRDWVIQKENLEVISLDYINGYFLDY